MLIDKSVSQFLDATASNDPVPGGGSIAANSGATAAALVEMVANLTIGKKKYEDVNDEMKDISKKANALRQQLLKYVDIDSEAFNRVMNAYKLPKDTEEQKIVRKMTIQNAMKYAASVPLEVAKKSYDIMELSMRVVESGNKNAVTDGAVSVMMARTAVLSALYNVKINLLSIKDNIYVEKIDREVSWLKINVINKEKEILGKIEL
ncbi:cyclodeaminase/cyclohydrolase family protein [Vallitalea sp.]|jgi:formiminotetrahydrofolate cyclodeaminase|uniref:cyclodeaminase/cyclohydrolase family protein n=1 Tax=Vallitalea sp. TaxID=1882829 RepID=UPI0025E89DCD|nr:cyclodeaminase/cyclohydrolase family protein [Vallitalea sp.]MCT4687274.1 cyclodeaminase/cyclohydrolase family protein [Vallitalea sp.]